MTFSDRIDAAEQHELAVSARLTALGWAVSRFGQGQLPSWMRDLLRRTESDIRWLPDLIAVRSPDTVRLVEAKTGNPDTPNYAIEKASLAALYRLHVALGTPVRVVFHDFAWESADALHANPNKRTGPPSRNGSGTPYWLFPRTELTHHLPDPEATPNESHGAA